LSHAGEAPGEAPSPQSRSHPRGAEEAWVENGAGYGKGGPWCVKHPEGFSDKSPPEAVSCPG